MKTTIIRSSVLFCFALAACGGPGGEGAPVADKSQAAQAAYRTQQTGDGLKDRQSQGLVVAQVGGIPGINEDGVNTSTEYTVNGEQGQAKVSLQAAVSGGDVETKYTVEYDGYSGNGIDFIDGQVQYVTSVQTSGAGASVQHTVVGQVVIWGSQAATLDLDTSLTVQAGAGGASVIFNGEIVADGQAFSYSDESFDLDAGVF